MDAVTGVVDKEKGEGLASLSGISPCFSPAKSATAQRNIRA